MRKREWQSELAAFIKSRKSTPFQWGTNDCCLFAADAVLAMTGEDFALPFRGTYSTALEATRLLSEMGGLRGVAISALGDSLPGKMARVGDVCLVLNEGREVLMVHGGNMVYGPGESGVTLVQPSTVIESWRID